MSKRAIKIIIGLLILVLILHLVYSNFNFFNNMIRIKSERRFSENQIELDGTESEKVIVEPLKIKANYFRKDLKRDLFLINISNVDNVKGNVTVGVGCNETGFSVNHTRELEPAESYVFEFPDKGHDCELEHYFKAQDVRRVIKE